MIYDEATGQVYTHFSIDETGEMALMIYHVEKKIKFQYRYPEISQGVNTPYPMVYDLIRVFGKTPAISASRHSHCGETRLPFST